MSTLAIHRLHTRLRLPPAQADVADRLRRLLGRLVDSALEPALERAGLDDHGELCIRRIDMPPLRLDLAATDTVIVERWAQDWAAAIVRRVASADPGVVRYASRVQALIDLVESATRGDFTRAWAWRQLGLWSADDALTASDAAGLVLRALTGQARHAVAALAWFARQPTLFDRWLKACSDDALLRLAQAVLGVIGGSPAALEPLRLAQALEGAASRERERRRVHDHSAIAQALRRLPPGLADTRRGALAVLAIAECEPAWLRASPAEGAALIAEVAAAGPDERSAAVARDSSRTGLPGATTLARGRDARATATREPAAGAAPRAAGAAATPGGSTAAARAATQPARTPQPAADAAAPIEAPPAEIRQAATTTFGGLLFLLNLANDLDWPAKLLRDPALAPRGLRWTLHRLATDLLSLSADDPAALAFAGLRPTDRPPGDGEPPPDAAEVAALAQRQAELIAALRRRLPDDADGVAEAEAEPQRLLLRVCRRRAEVLADPGWIELHLSLEDVRTEIRVAGLDLDPGWLPWLGVVIRFVYS